MSQQTPAPTAEVLIEVLTSDDLNNDQVKKQLSNANEALCFLLHVLMVRHGFRLIGTDEHAEAQDINKQYILPTDWNRSKDVYTFKYNHYQSLQSFVLKCVTLGTSMIVSAVSLQEEKPYSMEMKVSDFITADNVGKLDKPLIDYFKQLQNIESLFKLNIANNLVPFLNKEGYERPSESQTTQAPAPQTNTERPRVQHQPPSRQPRREDDHDPLRIGPVRRGGFNPNPGYAGVGANDLYPSFHEPFGGTHRGGAPMFIGGGGNMVGPNHPGFFGGGGIPPMRGGPPNVPQGARFDPYGPNIGRVGRGNPNPDELRPPQFNEGDDDVNPFFF